MAKRRGAAALPRPAGAKAPLAARDHRPGDSIVVPKESTVRHNDTVWEDFSSADQIWDTATWIADGDMVPGDVIEVEISGIGTLRNPIVAEA